MHPQSIVSSYEFEWKYWFLRSSFDNEIQLGNSISAKFEKKTNRVMDSNRFWVPNFKA